MTRFYVWLWWFARERTIERLSTKHANVYREAHRAWAVGANLSGDLITPAWNTRGLADDLALHDAADWMLGRQA